MNDKPISAFQETLGMIYFARMIDKIRKQAAGRLHEDFVDNLGKGFDGRCCGFLRVTYEALKARVLEGGSDEDVLNWCFANGRQLDSEDIFIWNEFMRKRGWNDGATALVEQRKQESGLGHRGDIVTMLDYFDYDEGRKV